MLRASSLSFWQFYSTRDELPVEVKASNQKGGIAVELTDAVASEVVLVGLVDPMGVSRPKAFVWNASEFARSEIEFEKAGGSLLAVFVVLAFLSFFVGILNRDWSFFLFSGWLITSLRVASINGGWDLFWLGLGVSGEPLLLILRITLAAHPLLTTALFASLLRKELSALGLLAPLIWARTAFLGIFLASPFLDNTTLLPVIWISSALVMTIGMGAVILVVIKSRTASSIWYCCGWFITFLGYGLEVAYASGLLPFVLPGIDTRTTAMASAVVTTVALAEKLRIEIGGRVSAETATHDALRKLKANYESTPVGLFSLSADGKVTLCNPEFARTFKRQLVDGRFIDDKFDVLVGEGWTERLFLLSQSGPIELELEPSEKAEASGRWFLAKVTAKGDSIEGSIQDITERKEAEAKLLHLVDHDSLTGVGNRRGLERAMLQAQEAIAQGIPCAIAQVSLDRFKLINDLYGHAVGDLMLQQASARVIQSVRAGDHVSRIADSFVVVFFECPDFAVLGLTERLRECVQQEAFEIDGKRLDMTASVGVVSFDPTKDFVDTLASVGRACAEAKANGRNCVVRLDEKDSRLRAHLEEMRVVADLKRKVNPDRYFLHFQPVVSLSSPHSTLNYEVLLRMRDEQGGIIPPGRFIGAAERNGLMSDIDRWVLRSIFEWLDSHPEHLNRIGFTTVNISGASLNDSRFIEDAFSMFSEFPAPMRKLCFEITESVALTEIQTTRRFIDRIRDYGGKLALDDFGAGYTSFNYLKEIPADFIKIDGIFVRDINLNPANFAITRTIVDLTHELGMQSIAEWAETPDTVATLVSLGVDYGQGFGLARPMDKETVTQALSCGDLVKDEAVLAVMKRPPRAVSRASS